MTTSKELDRAISETHINLIDVEASVPTGNNSGGGNNSKTEEEQLRILELGRLTQICESNLNTLNNYLPSVSAKDLTRYPDYYSKMEESASREIKEYEDMMAIAEDNAAKAGIVNPKQSMAEFAQDCKQAYLDDCKKKEERLKQIKIIIHSDGTMTSLDTATGETAKFDNQFNPID